MTAVLKVVVLVAVVAGGWACPRNAFHAAPHVGVARGDGCRHAPVDVGGDRPGTQRSGPDGRMDVAGAALGLAASEAARQRGAVGTVHRAPRPSTIADCLATPRPPRRVLSLSLCPSDPPPQSPCQNPRTGLLRIGGGHPVVNPNPAPLMHRVDRLAPPPRRRQGTSERSSRLRSFTALGPYERLLAEEQSDPRRVHLMSALEKVQT